LGIQGPRLSIGEISGSTIVYTDDEKRLLELLGRTELNLDEKTFDRLFIQSCNQKVRKFIITIIFFLSFFKTDSYFFFFFFCLLLNRQSHLKKQELIFHVMLEKMNIFTIIIFIYQEL